MSNARPVKPRPIGRVLRTNGAARTESVSFSKTSLLTLDEQLAKLERETQSGSDSDSGQDSDDDEEGSDDNSVEVLPDADNHLLVEKDSSGKVTRLISSIDEDKIAPLPKKYLPGLNCSTSKKFARTSNDDTDNRAKRIRFNERPSSSSGSGRGLEATVRELIRQYEPASLEKRPFYCRICKHQAADLAEWEAHRQTDFHITASDMERKMSSCKICRKQFTSPDQLKEHLKGKAHIEKMERAKEYQQNRKKFC